MSIWSKMKELLSQRPFRPDILWQPKPDGKVFEPDRHYLQVYLLGMSLAWARKLWTKRYPVIYVVSELLALDKRREIPVVVGPDCFQGFDPNHLDRVVVLDQRVLGPVPYLGEDLGLIVGLCAVKQSSLLDSLLGLLDAVSRAAEVPTLGAGLAVARPVVRGVEDLIGLQDVQLDVGVRHTLRDPGQGGPFTLCEGRLIVAAGDENHPLDPATVSLADDGRLLEDGKPAEGRDYFALEVVARETRNDWRSLPGIKQAVSRLMGSIGSSENDFKRALRTATQAVLASPDLTEPHRLEAATAMKQRAEERRMVLGGAALLKGPSEQEEAPEAWPEELATAPLSRAELEDI